MMNRLLLLLLIFCLSIDLLACKCPNQSEINYFDLQFNDFVFRGKCLRIIKKGKENYALFKIDKIFKGTYTKSTVELLSSNIGGGDCKINYKVNEVWFNIVNMTPKGYYGSLCGKSTKYNSQINNEFEKLPNPFNIKNKVLLLKSEVTSIKGKITNGVEEGVWSYHNRGIIELKIKYLNGKIVYCNKYDSEGKLYSSLIFKNAQLIKSIDLDEKGTQYRKTTILYKSDNIIIVKEVLKGKTVYESKINLTNGNYIDRNGNFYIDRPLSRKNIIEEIFYPKKFPR